MIGPHEGKELELMLAGKKHLAVFCDAIPENGIIPEEIIPEKKFEPFVKQGQIVRLCHESQDKTHNVIVRRVLFALKGHEWMAHAFLWMHEECLSKRRPFDDAYEYFVGRLLGYSEEDISEFITKVRYKNSAGSAPLR